MGHCPGFGWDRDNSLLSKLSKALLRKLGGTNGLGFIPSGNTDLDKSGLPLRNGGTHNRRALHPQSATADIHTA